MSKILFAMNGQKNNGEISKKCEQTFFCLDQIKSCWFSLITGVNAQVRDCFYLLP